MLGSWRIAGVQQLEKQLRSIVKEESMRCTAAPNRHNSNLALPEELRRYGILKDKLLFRRVPVALSLLERSLLPATRGQKNVAAAVSDDRRELLVERLTTMTRERLQRSDALLRCGTDEGIHQHEHQNEQRQEEKNEECPDTSKVVTSGTTTQQCILGHPKHMLHLFCSLHFLEQERRKLYRHHLNRLTSKLKSAQRDLSLAQKRRGGASELLVARETLSEAKADVSLLQNSLLSRSYLSVRLWRLLLREELWLAALCKLEKKESITSYSLLMMLLSLTRLSFGVLQDVFQGHALNTRAPRFAVSIPSRKMRHYIRRAKTSTREGGHQTVSPSSPHSAITTPTTESVDRPWMSSKRKTASVTGTTVWAKGMKEGSSTPGHFRKTKRGKSAQGNSEEEVTKIRWLPPSSSSHDAVSLALETLAMCSFLIPVLDTEEFARNGQVQDLFELMSVLQATASSILALGVSSGLDEAKMHRTLRRLEDAMLDCGAKSKAVFVTQTKDVFSALSPIKAARLLLGLNSMHLLSAEEADSQKLFGNFVMSMFPQLSNGTQRNLLEKSRQNVLFAFATRGQRLRLHRRCSSRQEEESALLDSVRARARLQQRQMQAALRGKYLEEVNNRSVGQLAECLPVYSLVVLFHLLARAAYGAPRHVPEAQGRLITAALFVAEGILVAGTHASLNSDIMLQTSDLPTLLTALGVLRSLVIQRYQILQHSLTKGHYSQKKKISNNSIAKSELMIVSCITDMVFNATNAALAERVQHVEVPIHSDKEVNTTELLSVNDVMAIVEALSEWCIFSQKNGSLSKNNNNKCATHVSTTCSMIKRLFLADVLLWKHLQKLNKTERDQFLRTLSDVMQQFDMMDATVTRALSTVC